MGYRSLVGINCEEKAYEKFAAVVDVENDCDVYKDMYGRYTLVWEWVKWYPSFMDVKDVEKVMDELDRIDTEEISGYGYKFIEVGEDGVIDSRANDYENVELYLNYSFDIFGDLI